MINESNNIIKCRKCGGSHFTIKCGKEPIQDNIIQVDIKETPKEKFRENKNRFSSNNEKYYPKITYRVKLSELPKDMFEEEMLELVSEWGHIIKVKLINYDENSVAYIDFGFEDEALYFIEAIDKTPFESLLLSATKVDSY